VSYWLIRPNLGFGGIAEPQLDYVLPLIAWATNRIGYMRFHGRDSTKFWHGQAANIIRKPGVVLN
jgi:hypothetical protein